MSIGEKFATRNEVEALRRKLAMIVSGKNIIQPSPEVITGPEAFVELSDVPSAYTAAGNFVVRVNSTVDGLEFAELKGTTNQVTVTANAADYTLSLPQDIHTGASPTFVTAKLSALTDGYVPYHVSDAVGLADSPMFTDGTSIVAIRNDTDSEVDPILQFTLGATPVAKFAVGVDTSWGEDLTICLGAALTETHATGCLIDIFGDGSEVDVYPMFYAGIGNDTEIDLQANIADGTTLAEIYIQQSETPSDHGHIGIKTYGAATTGEDTIDIWAGSGIIEMYAGANDTNYAYIFMEGGYHHAVGASQIWIQADSVPIQGTVYLESEMDSAPATQNELRFRQFTHPHANYIGFKAAAAISANFTLTLPSATAGAKKHLLTGATDVLGWGQNVDTDGTPSFVNLGLGTTTFGASANYVLTILNGTAPGVLANCFGEYSADAGGIGGHAAPHWIGEAGGIASLECGGGTVNEYRYYADLANDAILTLPFSITSSARGFIAAGNNEERTDFWVDNDGDVTLVNNSTNVVANADTDDKLCIGTAAAQEPLQIKNRLNATKKIFLVIWYN